MKVLYLDCSMGCAGDMMTASLLALHDEPDAALGRLNALGIPGVAWRAETATSSGIAGVRVHVSVDGIEEGVDAACAHKHHGHTTLDSIRDLAMSLDVSPMVKEDIRAVYQMLADAESHVHGVAVEQIHFHEVGAMDAVADIAATSLLLRDLAPEQVVCSPVAVGYGRVRCAHGELPVPAPATAHILRGVPIYAGSVEGELCTPTGAALVMHYANEFGPMPAMRVEGIGYGMGAKNYGGADFVRALYGKRA